jgi:alginate O-acetyltransferase complex protein AlgI
MLFSSIIFLIYFVPVFFLAYYAVPYRLKNVVCLAGSLFFYAWGEPYYVLLMLFSIAVNYMLGLALGFERPDRARKCVMILACVYNIAMLIVFKYLSFFIQTAFDILKIDHEAIEISLPLGISFYTFQALSYVFDVYRKEVAVQKRPLNLALYICMFPQLVAGPIVRYGDINAEIDNRRLNISDISGGIFRFTVGMAKKVIIANEMGKIADTVWGTQDLNISVAAAWTAMIAYTLQIYFDFSGYSDMAIGLGRMMGFHFAENFNYPYISGSVSEFWRRWHISLGSWFRDYVYFPLGGSYTSKGKMIRNLLIVWSITGFWHGAEWTFLLWGFYYGVLICIEKVCGFEERKIPALLCHIYCLFAVMFGWVIFRSDSVLQALTFFERLVGIGAAGMSDTAARLYIHDNMPLMIIACIGSTPVVKRLTDKLPKLCIMIVLLVLSIIYMVNSTYNPFIYFRF